MQTESEEMEENATYKWKSKKGGSSNTHNRQKYFKVTRDKEGHYIMIKGSIQKEDITIVNIYVPNIGPHQYIRQLLTAIKGEINSNTITVGDFNIPLTQMDRSSRHKFNKETQA